MTVARAQKDAVRSTHTGENEATGASGMCQPPSPEAF